MRQLTLALFCLPLMGCAKLYADISGKVAGHSLSGTTAYWGGPYIVISDAELECMDMPWVKDFYNEDGDDVDTDVNQTVLQFTYESTELRPGKLSITKHDAGAKGWFLVVQDGEADVWQATGGNIEMEIDKKDRVSGTFTATFSSEGEIKGDVRIEKCSNLKPREY